VVPPGARLSGELLPWRILPRGTRAGILVGVRPPVVEATELAITELDIGLYRRVPPVGVLAPDLGGGWDRVTLPATLPARECAADGGGLVDLTGGGSPEGVFDRGGRALVAAAAISSR